MSAEPGPAIESAPSDMPHGIEIPLETFRAELPERPILLNDQPFHLAVQQERLAEAVSYVNANTAHRDRWKLRSLQVVLGSSLPQPVTKALRSAEEETEAKCTPLYQPLNQLLTITVPDQFVSQSISNDRLRLGVEKSINDDLRRGLEETMHLNNMQRLDWNLVKASAILGPLLGEAVAFGIATHADGIEVVAERALAGSIGGVMVALGALVLKRVLEPLEHFHQKAEKRAEADRPVMDNGTDLLIKLRSVLKAPVITLVTAEEQELALDGD